MAVCIHQSPFAHSSFTARPFSWRSPEVLGRPEVTRPGLPTLKGRQVDKRMTRVTAGGVASAMRIHRPVLHRGGVADWRVGYRPCNSYVSSYIPK